MPRPIREGDQARYRAGYWLECQPAKGQLVDVHEQEPSTPDEFWCEWVDLETGKEREMVIPAADLELEPEDLPPIIDGEWCATTGCAEPCRWQVDGVTYCEQHRPI